MNPIRTIYVPLKAEVQIEMEWLVKVTPDFPDLIEVKDNYGAVVDVDIKVDNNIVILTPKKLLAPNTKYKVTLKGGHQGIRGKNREIMAEDKSFVFYTGAAKGNVFEDDAAKHKAGQVAAWKNDSPKGVEPDHEVRTTRFLIHDDSDANWDSEKMESTLTGVTGDFAMTYTDLAVHKKDPDSSVDFFFRSTCNKGVTIFTALQGAGRVSDSSQVRNARLGVTTKEAGITMEGSLLSDKDGSFLTLFQRKSKPVPTSLEGEALSAGHAMLYLLNDNTLRFWDGKASNEMTVLCSNREANQYLEWSGSTLRLIDKGKVDPKVSIGSDGVWLRAIRDPSKNKVIRHYLEDGLSTNDCLALWSLTNDYGIAQASLQHNANTAILGFSDTVTGHGTCTLNSQPLGAHIRVSKDGSLEKSIVITDAYIEGLNNGFHIEPDVIRSGNPSGRWAAISRKDGCWHNVNDTNKCQMFHDGSVGIIATMNNSTVTNIPIARIYYKPTFTGYTKDIRFEGGAVGDGRLQGGITFQTDNHTYTFGGEGGASSAALWRVDNSLFVFQIAPVLTETPEVVIDNITIKAGTVETWTKEIKDAVSDWYVLSKFDCEDEMLPKVYKLIFDADILEDGKVVLRIYNPSKEDVTISGTATFRFLV